MFETPILFIIYNRPEITKRVFDVIKKIKPKYLYVAGDGAKNSDEDRINVERTREVVKGVDWDCILLTNFQESNLGCKNGPVRAISWFFKHVEYGIILEDDILAEISFFSFCEVLLKKYENAKKIMSITGINWQDGKIRGDASYYFSAYPGIWGWATWKDRWAQIDLDLLDLNEYLDSKKIIEITKNIFEQEHHISTFKKAIGADHIWDYQWKYTVFKNQGLCIVPNLNLISNIGFGNDATHTTEIDHWKANRKTFAMDKILIHPKKIERHLKADKYMAKKNFNRYTFFRRAMDSLKYRLRKLLRDG